MQFNTDTIESPAEAKAWIALNAAHHDHSVNREALSNARGGARFAAIDNYNTTLRAVEAAYVAYVATWDESDRIADIAI